MNACNNFNTIRIYSKTEKLSYLTFLIMGDTNFIGSIVKILETPKQNFINKDILFTSFRAL
mgnify:CR=1 FL=1